MGLPYPIITKHGKKRLKGRLGLAKRAHLRHVKSVLKTGTYLYRDKCKNVFFMQCNGFEYVFDITNRYVPILVTVYNKKMPFKS